MVITKSRAADRQRFTWRPEVLRSIRLPLERRPLQRLQVVVDRGEWLDDRRDGCTIDASLQPEFEKRNCKIVGLSVDSVANHLRWMRDIESTQGYAVDYPMIGDADLSIAKLYGMLPAEAQPGVRTAADNATVRSLIVIGPDKKIKAMTGGKR